ncbi:hypothetical protein SARC_06386 [Sphaeroforma arctica JP610]|uniref:Uncharacterized protein n=1 Tax=Sphaeroforma arctica JP610 TaxID=667725 RepID=A0A0L0FWQ6_9EUKA|nr:hypothetical protein SARC_06386 [Sphaeroforma arctica JP610]KNC81275.1 hypothetical protein SARC_06386 [Sphaeroforma arctica JP610]|eukprot:XP_014155177.1 hypothetical protein SARC_06386 [Sphaeroforma arctica JP610]
MLQILFPFLAGAIEAYCIAVSFVSIWSQDWYTGDGGSYGIATGCQDGNATAQVGDAFKLNSFCEFSWGDLEGTTQKITACFLFAGGVLGIVAFLLLLIMVFGHYCFEMKPFAGMMVKYICILQSIALAGALIAIAGFWRWGTPPDTNVGAMFYLVVSAAGGAFICAILLDWTYQFNKRRARIAHKKATEPSPLERSKPPGYGQSRNGNTRSQQEDIYHSQVNIDDSKADLMDDQETEEDASSRSAKSGRTSQLEMVDEHVDEDPRSMRSINSSKSVHEPEEDDKSIRSTKSSKSVNEPVDDTKSMKSTKSSQSVKAEAPTPDSNNTPTAIIPPPPPPPPV